MFTPIQQSTALPPLLSDLELLPGVIPLCREHGRGSLRPLNHFLLAQLPFAFAWSIFNCWFEENTGKHLQAFIKSSSVIKIMCNSLGGIICNNRQTQ